MRTFRVKAGKHSIRLPNGKVKTFKTGDLVTSAENLCDKFLEKFEEVQAVSSAETALELAHRRRQEAAAAAAATVEEEEDLPPEPEEEVTEEAEIPDFGKDVSKKFGAVTAGGLQVFQDDEMAFSVVRGTEILAGPFEDKVAVIEWFKKWKKANK